MVRLTLHITDGGEIFLVISLTNGGHEAWKVGQGDEEWHEARSKARLLFRSLEIIHGRGNIKWEEYP